jgi:hypothetical protein
MYFWKNRPKCSQKPFFNQNQCITLTGLKCGLLVIFQKSAKRKQSPDGPKFAQSGHPVQKSD